MSTDRELLELAAKAAGIKLDWEGVYSYLFREFGDAQLKIQWRPLTDDGDRLRLARRLGITIHFGECCAWTRLPNGNLIQEFWGGDCGDEAHAILRVAAEIGKAMP